MFIYYTRSLESNSVASGNTLDVNEDDGEDVKEPASGQQDAMADNDEVNHSVSENQRDNGEALNDKELARRRDNDIKELYPGKSEQATWWIM